MDKYRRPTQHINFRKTLRLFDLARTFITILLVHLSVVFGVYLLIKSRSYPTDGSGFIQAVGMVVMVCGLLTSFFWRFISKLATEGLLMLADIADGLSYLRGAVISVV